MTPVHIIGVPLDLGGGRRGVDMGPSAFRIAGLADRLAALGIPVSDKGDISVAVRETIHALHPDRRYIDEIARACSDLYASSLRSLEAGAVPIVLGGDHSIGAGSVAAAAAFARQQHGLPIGLLWVDAHGDMNTPATSPSGNVHGMPMAAVLGYGPRQLTHIYEFAPKIFPENAVMIGLPSGHGIGRGCGFKTDGKEHDLLLGILFRQLQCIERRVDDANVSALGFGIEQTLRRSRDAQHVSEGSEDSVRTLGDGEGFID